MNSENRNQIGIFCAIGAYFMWGIFPLYWKPLNEVPAFEILAHRIFWAFIFMIVLLIWNKRFHDFIVNFKVLFKPMNFILVFLAAVLISINWCVYIWAVNNGHVIETSLGYYINPLISILLAIIFLKEKLNLWQIVAIGFATVGVLILTIEYGQIPYVALTLALSFGFYGLVKKFIHFDSTIGLTYETLFVTPIALGFLIFIQAKGTAAFGNISHLTTILLIGTGVATALPLLCFAEAGKRIPLSMLGFFQYIAPTMTLILGLTVFKESFSHVQFISFIFIWIALVVFSLSGTKFMARLLPKGHSVRVK
ncbi:EamA family transporter RarD [Terrilactibacillus sp. BCM23-1]|uniref:EamA family transporter RarD n=1 Tax=Terrilactibacillus tamarindi TaxID=2599694 RepID=A0A6N8CPJ9_9BACI|nr:EamA family transporter RarD [Terrilactibacillus tamarindi]MTT32094.1 EamA family transporter RarD [Terrilactibacillus tamarindi]